MTALQMAGLAQALPAVSTQTPPLPAHSEHWSQTIFLKTSVRVRTLPCIPLLRKTARWERLVYVGIGLPWFEPSSGVS